jgi:Domain of unknown function (DUF6894)
MTRYFFDFVGRDRNQYDYHGRVFKTPEHARGFAELMALDLGIEPDTEWVNIHVRDARGHLYFSVPVELV